MKINSAKRQLRHSQRVLPQFDVALSLSLSLHTQNGAQVQRERKSERACAIVEVRLQRVGVVGIAGSTNQSASLPEPVWQVGLVLSKPKPATTHTQLSIDRAQLEISSLRNVVRARSSKRSAAAVRKPVTK